MVEAESVLEVEREDGPATAARRAGKRKRTGKREHEAMLLRKKEREDKLANATARYQRDGARVKLNKIKNKRLRRDLAGVRDAQREAAEAAARAEVLLTEQGGFLEAEGELERTSKVTQKQIESMADINSRAKMLDLRLEEYAPYRVAWTKNGRSLLMGGHKGHISVVDALRNKPACETHVGETIRDVTFLHNQTMHAVAQKKYIYIYDETGAEVHRLRSHIRPDRLEFLPYHFLLASVGRGGWLKYQDISTGELVSEHRTRLGPCNVMRQNPYNAVMCLGHGNGTVTMWSPASAKPLVKMFCHDGAIGALAISRGGNEMATAGRDGKLTIWDVRTYKKLHSYFTPRPPNVLDISQTGLLAVGCGHQVQIWKDALRTKAQEPYMLHKMPGREITDLSFRPYEDVLGLGHTAGVSTILVPGAGVANYDAFEANPFESRRQRRETEVHSLLEKLQPDMIVLDPSTIGQVDRAPIEQQRAEEAAERETPDREPKAKNKQRGKNKIGRRMKKKHRNIISQEREALREKLEKEREESKASREGRKAEAVEDKPAAFQRFARSKYSNRSKN